MYRERKDGQTKWINGRGLSDCSDNTRSAIFRICICHYAKSVNFKSIILYEKIFDFAKLFHSDVNKPLT